MSGLADTAPAKPAPPPPLASGSLRAPLAVGVVLAAAALFLVRLGATDLWAPDEPRYGQVAEELRSFQHGARGLWLLHLNGVPYTQKPPLYFWLAALAGAPAGRVNEIAARLPSALAGIACIALLIFLGTRMRGAAVGVGAGGLLATTFLFAHLARRAQLDVLLCACELLALSAFWRLASAARSEPQASEVHQASAARSEPQASEVHQASAARSEPQARQGGGAGYPGAVPAKLDRSGTHRARDAALLHGGIGLAVLVKGPVGLILPALAILSFLAWERRLADLRRCLPIWGPLLSVGPGLIWIAGAVTLAPPGFSQEAILENLWGRFAEGTSHARPFWYYLYSFPLDFLPWTLLAPLVVVAGRRVLGAEGSTPRAQAWRFLLAWLGSALVFFSLSSGKRGLYLLPAFPAAALLCADAVVGALRAGARPPRWAGRLALALSALLLAVGLAARAVAGRFGAELSLAFPVLCLGLAAAALLGLRAARRSWPGRAGVVLSTVALAELLVFALLFPAFDTEKSPRRIALEAAALTPPGASIGVTRSTLVGGLAYYGGRRVTPLKTPEAIEAFLADGGRAIVTEARNLHRIESVAPVEIRFRARQGRRALVVVTPAAIASPSPSPS
jgi:4-amino-4-deoxy-L-arabinose transferase-like glycosyltransferase